MRYPLFHIIEGFVIYYPALIMMNEIEDDRSWKQWKLVGVIILNYMASVIIKLVPRMIGIPAGGMFSTIVVLIPMLLFCTVFTGGVAKIAISVLLLDMWTGAGEMLMTIVYCIVCRKELAFLLLPQFEGNILLQCIIQISVGILMLLVSKPLFYKYQSTPVLEEKTWVAIGILYFCVGAAIPTENMGIDEKGAYSYLWTLLFIVIFINIFFILLGYNRKKILDAKLQSLYLKQKMEREYALVFEDMDRDMRRFRHDVKKHMDALSYIAEQQELHVSAVQLKQYQQDLKNIYTELTYGNYCGKYDVDLVLMRLEDICREKNMEFLVALKSLDLDSLPVHIRVQLFESLGKWVENTVNAGYLSLSFNGMSSAGFHTLKISLQQESWSDEKKKGQERKRRVFDRNTVKKMKNLLCEYSPIVKTEYSNGERAFITGWHGGEIQ